MNDLLREHLPDKVLVVLHPGVDPRSESVLLAPLGPRGQAHQRPAPTLSPMTPALAPILLLAAAAEGSARVAVAHHLALLAVLELGLAEAGAQHASVNAPPERTTGFKAVRYRLMAILLLVPIVTITRRYGYRLSPSITLCTATWSRCTRPV